MRKKTLIIIAVMSLICISSGLAGNSEKENKANTPSELAESMLDNFALAQKGTEKGVTTEISGHFSLFQRFLATDESDLPLNVSGLSAGRAAEFATVSSSPGVGFGLRGLFSDKSSFDFSGIFLHKDEQSYSAGLDLGRIVRLKTLATRFIHRLDHDPLTNVVSEEVDPEAHHEFPFQDSNPLDVYSTTRTEIINKTDLVIPSFPNLKIKSQVRYVHENGLQQARTLDVCTVCHIEAKTQGIDQRTRDFILGAELKTKGVVLSYAHLGRSFESKANPIYHDYTNPYRFFIYSGRQEFAHIPDSEKNTNTFKAKIDAVKNASLFGSYTLGKIKNKDNNGQANINNFLSRFRALLVKGLNLTLRFINSKYENKMDPDFSFDGSTLEANHLNKDSITVGADISYRVPRQKINLRAGLDYNKLKRTFDWATEVEEEEKDIMDKYLKETKTITYRASAAFYPSSKIQGFLRYKRKDIDKPLGVPLLAEENPLDPTTERFMSSLYTDINLLAAGISTTPTNRISIAANYFYNSSKNDQLNSSQKRNNIVLSLWYGLSNKISLTASYTYQGDKTVNNLLYGTDFGLAYEDQGVPYKRKANVFLVAFDLHPSEEFSIFSDISVTTGKANWESAGFHPSVDTSDIATYSDQDLTHYRISAGASYSFMKNMSFFGKWKYEDYKDKAFTLYADSGKYHIFYFGFGYKF